MAAAFGLLATIAGCTEPTAPPAAEDDEAPQVILDDVPRETFANSTGWDGSVMQLTSVYWVDVLAGPEGTVAAVPWIERSVDDGGDVDATFAVAVEAEEGLLRWMALADAFDGNDFVASGVAVATPLSDGSSTVAVPRGPLAVETGPTSYILDQEASAAPQPHDVVLAAAADPPAVVRFWLKPLRERGAAVPPSLAAMLEQADAVVRLDAVTAEGAWADRLADAEGAPRSPGVDLRSEGDGLPVPVSAWSRATVEHPPVGGWAQVDWLVAPPFHDLQATATLRGVDRSYDALAPSPLPNGTTGLQGPVRGQWAQAGNGASTFRLDVQAEQGARPSMSFTLVSLAVDPRDLLERLD
jgi:hypothetical protein